MAVCVSVGREPVAYSAHNTKTHDRDNTKRTVLQVIFCSVATREDSFEEQAYSRALPQITRGEEGTRLAWHGIRRFSFVYTQNAHLKCKSLAKTHHVVLKVY